MKRSYNWIWLLWITAFFIGFHEAGQDINIKKLTKKCDSLQAIINLPQKDSIDFKCLKCGAVYQLEQERTSYK